MPSRLIHANCRCGDASFEVRIERDEQVGLLTCGAGHHSLLLDSRDCWGDVIQHRRPPIMRCRCKGGRFTATFDFDVRDDGDVRSIAVDLTCEACGLRRRVVTVEIDYAPTAQLLSRPLDPCESPWLKARRRSLTAFWTPADLELALRLAPPGESRFQFVAWGERPQAVPVDGAVELVLNALAGRRLFNLYVTNQDVELPAVERDCWRNLPLVRISSPTCMSYTVSMPTHERIEAMLYYVEFAQEFIVAGQVVRPASTFVAFCASFLSRLRTSFVSDRGPDTVDAAAEYSRVAPALMRRR